MHRTFETPGPTALYVEIGSGEVTLHCEDVDRTTVEVTGRMADEVVVEQRGDQIVVIGPKGRSGGLFGGGDKLDVQVTLPTASTLAAKLGSADLGCTGRLGETRVKTGSGDVTLDLVDGDALVETGSGDVEIGESTRNLRVKTGSGDVEVGQAGGPASVNTASGDTEIGNARNVVAVKSASGDMRVRQAHDDVALSTASGDLVIDTLRRGRLEAKNVSGDIRIGIPAGVPVWTDISTLSGEVHSSLRGAGRPEEGQDHVELRAKTVSGDIALVELS